MRDLLYDLNNYAWPANYKFRLRNDLYCFGWGVKLYSLTPANYRYASDTVNDDSASSGISSP